MNLEDYINNKIKKIKNKQRENNLDLFSNKIINNEIRYNEVVNNETMYNKNRLNNFKSFFKLNKNKIKKVKKISLLALVYPLDGILENDFNYLLDKANVNKNTANLFSLSTRITTTIPNIRQAYGVGKLFEIGLNLFGIKANGFPEFSETLYTSSRIYEDIILSYSVIKNNKYKQSPTMYMLPFGWFIGGLYLLSNLSKKNFFVKNKIFKINENLYNFKNSIKLIYKYNSELYFKNGLK